MDTKLTIALLSGISLFMSVGAFAVSDDLSSDDLNWSYVMGGTKTADIPSEDAVEQPAFEQPAYAPEIKKSEITCTAGCPGRPAEPVEPLTLTYEDEAMPLAERVGTFAPEDRFEPKQTFPVQEPTLSVQESITHPSQDKPLLNSIPQIETRYVTTPAKTQYPITRQYPISVQYPITVQRNMTVEQPVLMQQPIVIRRPVVMQQDITVQRQPTIIQQQPMIMQQQPSLVQQQPVFVQAPAATLNPMMLGGLNGMNTSAFPMTIPSTVTIPQQSIPLTQPAYVPMPYQSVVPQYPVQQPVYQAMAPMYLSVPMVQATPTALPAQAQQQPYQN